MYVGRSSDPLERYRAHLSDKLHPGKWAWISELIQDGLRPNMLILDCGIGDEANALERVWIEHYDKAGHGVLNILREPAMIFNITHEDA